MHHRTTYRALHLWTFFLLMVFSLSCQSQPTTPKEHLSFTTVVRSLLQDSKGNLWIGSDREGVCLVQNGRYKYFTTADGLSDNQVRCIYEDVNGIIWFECGRGLSTYDGKKMTVYHQRNYGMPTQWKAGEKNLWFKGDEIEGYNSKEQKPGVYQYDGKILSYQEFPVTPKSVDERRFTYGISTPFFRGKNNTVWFGMYKCLIGYDGKTFKVITDESLKLDGITSSLHIRGFLEDRNGKLWIANNGKGVLVYDGKEAINFTIQHKLTKADTKGYSLDRTFSIAEDAQGTIWIGTVESGIWRYDGKTVTNYTEKDGLNGLFIPVIYRTPKGDMLFGGNGVYRFNGKSFERVY